MTVTTYRSRGPSTLAAFINTLPLIAATTFFQIYAEGRRDHVRGYT